MNEQERDGPKKRDVNVRFPVHLLERLREIGYAEGRSQNSAILWAVVEYLQERGYDVDIGADRGKTGNDPNKDPGGGGGGVHRRDDGKLPEAASE